VESFMSGGFVICLRFLGEKKTEEKATKTGKLSDTPSDNYVRQLVATKSVCTCHN